LQELKILYLDKN